MGRLNSGVSASSSTTIAGPRYSANQLIGAPRTGPTISATHAAQRDREQRGDDRRAAAEHHARRNQTRTRRPRRSASARTPGGIAVRRSRIRSGTPTRPMMMPPKPRYWMNLTKPSGGASSPIALSPSWSSISADKRREACAADHHQVGGPPQRDVLAEDAVPDVVEREADQCVQAAAGHQDTADRRVPVAGDPHRGRAGLVVRQHDRHAARDEEQEQAEQDEVVRRVGQRSRVAALADVQADVPDEAEQRADERRDEQRHRQRHPRRPLELAAGLLGEVVQPGDAPGSVQVADPAAARP